MPRFLCGPGGAVHVEVAFGPVSYQRLLERLIQVAVALAGDEKARQHVRSVTCSADRALVLLDAVVTADTTPEAVAQYLLSLVPPVEAQPGGADDAG